MPCVPPTQDTLSKIINITYQVVVTVCVTGPHYNPDVIIPITIGTIPLVNFSCEMATPSAAPSAPLINHNYNQTDGIFQSIYVSCFNDYYIFFIFYRPTTL